MAVAVHLLEGKMEYADNCCGMTTDMTTDSMNKSEFLLWLVSVLSLILACTCTCCDIQLIVLASYPA